MKITAFISRVTAQYRASEALVLPVDGASGPLGADRSAVRERGRHAVVFEAARGVQAFVLQEEPAGVHAGVFPDPGRRLEQRLTFADRDDFVGRREWQQLVKPPDSAQGERIPAARPLLLEPGERRSADVRGPNRSKRPANCRSGRRPAPRRCRRWRRSPAPRIFEKRQAWGRQC